MIEDAADYLRKTRKGAMFVLDAPSGTGKNALINAIMAQDKNLKFSVSVTTREIREGEKDGVNYHYISKEEYDKLLNSDAFYEHVYSDYGACYGTLRSEVDSFINIGQDVIFDLDFPGACQMKEKAPNDVVTIGLLPPSVNELVQRLLKRGDSSMETITKRMKNVYGRLQHWDKYDYVVVNANFDETVGKLQRIISGERMKRVRQVGLSKFVEQLLEEAKEYV